MLITPTYIDRSPIHGIGLFAAEPIPTNTVIWKATPYTYQPISEETYQNMRRELSPVSFSQIDKYWVKIKGTHYLCIDDARYINHSSENCNTHYDTEKNELIAIREIPKGTEILENYDLFYPDEGAHRY